MWFENAHESKAPHVTKASSLTKKVYVNFFIIQYAPYGVQSESYNITFNRFNRTYPGAKGG